MPYRMPQRAQSGGTGQFPWHLLITTLLIVGHGLLDFCHMAPVFAKTRNIILFTVKAP